MISILIPTYNIEPWVERCLMSAVMQNYDEPYEIVVVDDGSTDHTLDCVRKIQAEHPGKIEFFSVEHRGTAATRNLCLKFAKGDFVFWLDGDDWIAENTLSECVRLMREYEVDAMRINFYKAKKREIKVYTHDEYMELLLSDRLKSYLTGMLICRDAFVEPFQDGNLVEDYAYHPHLVKDIRNILILTSPDLYHYTENRTGSVTNLTGVRAEGIYARLVNTKERYEEYHLQYPDACQIVLGQMADYTIMGMLLEDRRLQETAEQILRKYRKSFLDSKDIPAFRKAEMISLSVFPHSRDLIKRMHKWKERRFGTRKSDRRIR